MLLGAMLCFVLLMALLILVKAVTLICTGSFSISALLSEIVFADPVESALRVVAFPFVEEILFRYLFFWWFCRQVLGAGLMASFWWPFVAFVAGHLLDVIASFAKGDFLRIIDPVSIGAFNAMLMAHAMLVQGAPLWLATAACILSHAIYNLATEVARLLKVMWLLNWIRLAGLLTAIGVYWMCFILLRNQNLWAW